MNMSLHGSKTPGIIVNEICMMAATFKGTHFLLEGDDDCKFWKHYLHRENVSLVNCGGKPNLIGAANQIAHNPPAPVAGVYDTDFDRLRGIAPHAPTLLATTDANDLETTLLLSEALNKVLLECCDTALLAAFETAHNTSAVKHLEQTAREFGRLRLLNLIAGHKVNFDHLSPYRFVSLQDWSLDLNGLRQEYATQASISIATLENALNTLCPDATAWTYTQGHDAIRILAQGLRRTIGHQPMDESKLTKDLRLAFSTAMLQQTTMYATLRNIECKLPLPLFE